MKKAIPYYITIPLILFVLALISLFTLFVTRQDDPRVRDADDSYRSGEAAKTVASRKQAFNEALRIYLELEHEYHPTFGNGRLYYNIGNTYFQLEEYPWAIYNYLRAQSLMARDEKATSNLGIAQDKLSLEKVDSNAKNSFSLFFLRSYISLPERIQIFFLLSLFAFGFASSVIWYPNSWLNRGMWIALGLAGILLASLAYTQYFSPLRAVLVESSDLYRDGGMQYAKVGEAPLPAGSQVEVIDGMPNGQWLKIVSPKGDPGFVPREAIRLL